MDVKNLKKSSKALCRIEELDSEINKIEKVALVASNGKFESSFELKINDLSKKEINQKSIFDEDGSLKTNDEPSGFIASLSKLYGWPVYSAQTDFRNEKKQFDLVLNPSLSESSILRILAVLLNELQEERRQLLNQLEKMGVKV